MELNFFENGDIYKYVDGQNDIYLGIIDSDGDWRPCHGEEDDCPGDSISTDDMFDMLLDNLLDVGNWENRIPDCYRKFFLSDECREGTLLADRLSDTEKCEIWTCPECEESSIVQYRLPFATDMMFFNGNEGDGWQIIPYEALPEGQCETCDYMVHRMTNED